MGGGWGVVGYNTHNVVKPTLLVKVELGFDKMLWPKASPLDLDFGLCAWAKLFNNDDPQQSQLVGV